MISAPAQKSFKPVRILFRRGDHYYCGVCRSAYEDEHQACTCLSKCVMGLVQKEPIKKLTLRNGKIKYRCALCLRQYNDKLAAAHCFYECRQDPAVLIKCEYRVSVKKGNSPVLVPKILNGIKLDMSAEDAKVYAQGLRLKKAAANDKESGAGGSNVSGVNPDKGGSGLNTTLIEKGAIPPRPERFTQKLKEKTLRDGSRYTCAVCAEKYFTKMEASNCFESHAAEEERADQEWLSLYGGNSGVEVDKKGSQPQELTELEKRLAAAKK